MHLHEPSWWYGSPDGVVPRVLSPLAHVWARIAESRFAKVRPYRANVPVVCIGNFTAGGTGKTPLAREIAARLTGIGHTPIVLSRGYGGRITGPHLVDPEKDSAHDVGDEPLLHAAHTPTVIARDRAAGARFIEARHTTCDVIVMDDGLQNAALAKSLSIAVVDGRRGLGNGRVIPAGPLRACLEFQLGLSDVIVVVEPVSSQPAVSAVTGVLSARFSGSILHATIVPTHETDWLAMQPVVAWAGIGAPSRFFDLLRGCGAQIVHTAAFPDHHMPRQDEARALLGMAATYGAIIVTTQKDHARLRGGTGALAELGTRSRVLAVEMRLEQQSSARLDALLAGAVKAAPV